MNQLVLLHLGTSPWHFSRVRGVVQTSGVTKVQLPHDQTRGCFSACDPKYSRLWDGRLLYELTTSSGQQYDPVSRPFFIPGRYLTSQHSIFIIPVLLKAIDMTAHASHTTRSGGPSGDPSGGINARCDVDLVTSTLATLRSLLADFP